MERLSDLGERGFVRRIRACGLARPEGVIRGIGDDAAVFRVEAGRVMVVTTDMLLEGVHFRLGGDPFDLGARALAVNLSDIAAMGARPREAFLGLAAPGTLETSLLERFLDGFMAEARRHEVNLLGGDTCGSTGPLVVTVTVTGDAREESLAYRSGARPGDVVAVTGTLGDSAGGLMLLERGLDSSAPERRALVRAHTRPQARVVEGQWLATSGAVGAMIDLSDGLALDLRAVLAESGGAGATVDAAAVPLSSDLTAVAAELGADALALALGGGEDYELLVTLRAGSAAATARAYRERFGTELCPVGRIESAPGLRLARGGVVETLPDLGYDPWR